MGEEGGREENGTRGGVGGERWGEGLALVTTILLGHRLGVGIRDSHRDCDRFGAAVEADEAREGAAPPPVANILAKPVS